LSVGDQYFQEKRIRRMFRFWKDGKVIIFCSHTMFIVNQLCHRTIWLDHGTVRMQGVTSQVTSAYENYLREKSARAAEKNHSGGEGGATNTPVWIRSIVLNGKEASVELEHGADLDILMEFECLQERRFWVAAGIRRNDDLICHAVSMARDFPKPLSRKGVGGVLLRYRALPLLQGEYTVVVSVLDEAGVHCYHRKESSSFSIRPAESWRSEIGILELDHEWKLL
jgi:lipopolysaccharide transport system ATP-binding protein